MIVEFFGPPGAGKTTLARALLCRLRERGYTTKIALVHQPDKVSLFDPGGLGYALGRIGQAIVGVVAMTFHPITHSHAFSAVARLVYMLPPRNPVWFIRVSQYILRLSEIWRQSSDVDPIIVFDQAFIQAVCSLSVFSRTVDEAVFLRALKLIPKSDVAVYVRVDPDVQEARLRNRKRSEPVIARFFEAGESTNLQFAPIIESVNALLQKHGRPVVVVQLDEPSSIDHVVDKIEREILTRLEGKSNAVGHAVAGATQADQRCMICDDSIQTCDNSVEALAFPVPPTAAAVGARLASDRCTGRRGDHFTRATILALATYICGAGLTCAVQFLVARLLHAHGYGIYSYVWAWVSLLSYVTTLGLVTFVLRFTSAYRASDEWSLMYGSIRFAISRALAAAVMASIAGLVILWLRWNELEPNFAISLAIGIATIPLITLHLVGAGIIRVFGGFIAAILPERVFRDGLLLATVGFAAWGQFWPLDTQMVLVASFVSTAATLVFVIYVAIRLWPEQIKGIEPTYLPREWWSFALPVMMMMGLEILMARTGVLVLGWSGRISEAGLFALAFNLAMLIQLSRAAVSIYFSPTASAVYERGDFPDLQYLFARATVLSLAGGAMLALPVLILTGPLLNLFGQDFAGDTHIAQTLVMGQFLAAAGGPQQNLLTMTGHERSAAAIMLVFAALTIAGCAITTIHYGAMGAAVVTSGTLVAWNVAMAIHIKRCLGIKPGLVLAVTAFWTGRQQTMTAPQQRAGETTLNVLR
ncbi:oligosaccharide flippase family protein [Bradyrhizobium erythrophlei]|jgi:O-antigen/teichoic acid export membrane protein/thymidylate kinase|uniref:Membrane protein involved in the export of O-antigen and teichoic acid n=1 Tax=Bradyrhizobium erythrophlei TaxID=1437360 RepID=A0A1M5JQR9_9BRAD|nr:oligosaccharide flippase family protein [Bradyrhizobium erythrophlei]SHG42907.1 Membrane protein involved in the export of O-antigen and teichoic acid [Bradyrhizobium erythrophlei]